MKDKIEREKQKEIDRKLREEQKHQQRKNEDNRLEVESSRSDEGVVEKVTLHLIDTIKLYRT
jgi:hypothetical protein